MRRRRYTLARTKDSAAKRPPVSLIETVRTSQDAHRRRFMGLWRPKVVDLNLPRRRTRYRDFPIKTIA